VSSWIAVCRAALCRDGPQQMLEDAERAASEGACDGDWDPLAHTLVGVAHMLLGDDERADSSLVNAIERADDAGCRVARSLAFGERALLAAARDDYTLAETLVGEARDSSARLAGYAETAPALAVDARTLLRRGRWNEARARLEAARSLTGAVTGAVPWLAVQVRLELARAALSFRDVEGARERLAEAEHVLRLRPDLGRLGPDVDELRGELEDIPEPPSAGGTGLTAAELRLLPLLATHLSFREIGARLFVSRNTIKTQSISVYRKLGVSSRSEAIAEAGRLGLGGGSLARTR
jgi:LuxR family maltose regulon positive regulatory protein